MPELQNAASIIKQGRAKVPALRNIPNTSRSFLTAVAPLFPALAQADVTVTLKGIDEKKDYQWQVFGNDNKSISRGAVGDNNPFVFPAVMFGRGYRGPYKLVIREFRDRPNEQGRKVGEITLQRAGGKVTVVCR